MTFWETRRNHPLLADPVCKRLWFKISSHFLFLLLKATGAQAIIQSLFNFLPSMDINCFVCTRSNLFDAIHYCHRAVFITETCFYSILMCMRVCTSESIQWGFYLRLLLIGLHVWCSSVPHHQLSGTFNQEEPLWLRKNQWAASISEPVFPDHEYSLNVTISFDNNDLEENKCELEQKCPCFALSCL